MTDCQFTLNELFKKAIALTFPDLSDAPVIVQASQGDKFGDYQCNSAMAINQVMQNVRFTVFPQISTHALISTLPRISAHPLGQNSK